MRIFSVLVIALALSACGRETSRTGPGPIPEPGPRADNSVVRGIAVFTIESEQASAVSKLMHDFNNLFMLQSAFASTATTTVTYNNAAAVIFTVNTTNLVPGSFSGLNLNLGSFNITALKDNDTEVCGPLNDQQCANAYLRVYTTGSLPGFVNTSHSPQYSTPLYTSGESALVPMVLNSPGTNIKSVLGMAPTKHVVNLVDFVTTSYTVKTDFTNGGYGSYSATYVIEYVQSL